MGSEMCIRDRASTRAVFKPVVDRVNSLELQVRLRRAGGSARDTFVQRATNSWRKSKSMTQCFVSIAVVDGWAGAASDAGCVWGQLGRVYGWLASSPPIALWHHRLPSWVKVVLLSLLVQRAIDRRTGSCLDVKHVGYLVAGLLRKPAASRSWPVHRTLHGKRRTFAASGQH